jgi:hypothetical protein
MKVKSYKELRTCNKTSFKNKEPPCGAVCGAVFNGFLGCARNDRLGFVIEFK